MASSSPTTDADVFATATPLASAPAKARHDQKVVLVSLEARRQSNAHFFDVGWLQSHGVDEVLSFRQLDGMPSTAISYANFELRHALRPPLPVEHKIAAVAAFVTNCDDNTPTRRTHVLRALNATGVPVYSFGKCMQTHDIATVFPECASQSRRSALWDFKKLCVAQHFLFMLSFENSDAPGYVTEKLYQPLLAGSVPIYGGTADVRHLLPSENAAIVLDRFDDASIRDMSSTVKNAMRIKSAYNAMLR